MVGFLQHDSSKQVPRGCRKSLHSTSLGEVSETHLPRLFALKQGVNLVFNEGEPLSIILRKTIPFYKLVRRFQVFFDTTSINGQRHGASTFWAPAPKGQSSKPFIAGFASKVLGGEGSQISRYIADEVGG